jgi:hypothetical protein
LPRPWMIPNCSAPGSMVRAGTAGVGAVNLSMLSSLGRVHPGTVRCYRGIVCGRPAEMARPALTSIENSVTAQHDRLLLLLKLAKRGMEGDSAAARESLALIEEARTQQGTGDIQQFVIPFVDPGSVTYALLPLRMARKLDPFCKTVRDRPRTLARRGCVGPTSSYAQSRRSTDYREGHPHAPQGQVAQMVERKAIIQSEL